VPSNVVQGKRYDLAADPTSASYFQDLLYRLLGDHVGGFIDKFPAGPWMNRALTLKTGQCHVQRYMRPLLERIQRGEIDPTRVITHRLPLAQAPHGYDIFKHKRDGCEKVVLRP
jgi:threonine dehydrogenase-like Zn-dependent dehydrogenase